MSRSGVYRDGSVSPSSDDIDAAEWQRLTRREEIKEELLRYLDERKGLHDKWGELLKSQTKPDELDIPEVYWQEAQAMAKSLKQREEMSETYKGDFNDRISSPLSYCPSSSSSTSSCHSSSSMEFGALRVTSPFYAKAVPKQTCLKKESHPKQNDVHLKFGVVSTKIFYVSYKERRMKSQACTQEMVWRNSEEAKLESWGRIRIDGANDLDRLVSGYSRRTDRPAKNAIDDIDDYLEQEKHISASKLTDLENNLRSLESVNINKNKREIDLVSTECYVTAPQTRLILVKPAARSDLHELNDEPGNEFMGKMHEQDGNATDSKQTVTDEGLKTNTIKPRWCRRITEVIWRKLTRFGQRIKAFNCSTCVGL